MFWHIPQTGNSNTATKDGQQRTFDTRHRLQTQSDKTYSYDANNNRLKVEVDDVDRYYIYDVANNLLAEADENKHIIRYFVHGSGLSQMIQGVANQQQSYTYHYSANGHTLAMTDDQEAVLNQYAYSPYGRILGETETVGLEQPFKYVGQHGVQHEQGEIYYMRARYYDAEIGRFIKEDPIGFEGGLNVSLYVGGNPLVGVDPSGLEDPCKGIPNCTWTDAAGSNEQYNWLQQRQEANFGHCATAACAAGIPGSQSVMDTHDASVNVTVLGIGVNIGQNGVTPFFDPTTVIGVTLQISPSNSQFGPDGFSEWSIGANYYGNGIVIDENGEIHQTLGFSLGLPVSGSLTPNSHEVQQCQ